MVMKVREYLRENIDDHITINPCTKKKDFPIFLRNNYNFYNMKILGMECILTEVFGNPNINQLQKHKKQIENLSNQRIVFLYKDITRYRRKSLIENRISFVVEDGQMYLPFLGLDLKNVKEHIEKEVKGFTTSAQIAYLYFLYNKEDTINTTEFAKKMNFNNMTASRALNDLYNANLVNYEIGGKTGRSKLYKRVPDPDYFLFGQEYLKSPVGKTIYTKTKPPHSLTAGLDALAELSLINSPNHPIRAVYKNNLNRDRIEVVKNIDLIKDSQLIEVQLWDYDPKLFSNKGTVDLMSLYASLKEETDERIEQALDEVLRGESWYMD